MSEPESMQYTKTYVEELRAELDRLKEFERRIKGWTDPVAFYPLFMREYADAKGPTATVESCTRAALTACIYRAFKLCEGAVSKEEAEKIKVFLPR